MHAARLEGGVFVGEERGSGLGCVILKFGDSWVSGVHAAELEGVVVEGSERGSGSGCVILYFGDS